FSSRRRHTRSKRDWSSDVCSSDLVGVLEHLDDLLEAAGLLGAVAVLLLGALLGLGLGRASHGQWVLSGPGGRQLAAACWVRATRSEERRVGEGWGGGGSTARWGGA